MKRLMVAMLCLLLLVFGVSAAVIAGGGQVQHQERGEKDNPNDNGERTRQLTRNCVNCDAPIGLNCPECPECGCPQPPCGD